MKVCYVARHGLWTPVEWNDGKYTVLADQPVLKSLPPVAGATALFRDRDWTCDGKSWRCDVVGSVLPSFDCTTEMIGAWITMEYPDVDETVAAPVDPPEDAAPEGAGA